MPSVQAIEHDVCSFGIFSILTMQTRQEPSTLQAGVVAVVGNRDTGLDGGLQNRLAFFDRDLLPVDGQRDRFHIRPIISAGCRRGLAEGAPDDYRSSNSASAAKSRLICTSRTGHVRRDRPHDLLIGDAAP